MNKIYNKSESNINITDILIYVSSNFLLMILVISA